MHIGDIVVQKSRSRHDIFMVSADSTGTESENFVILHRYHLQPPDHRFRRRISSPPVETHGAARFKGVGAEEADRMVIWSRQGQADGIMEWSFFFFGMHINESWYNVYIYICVCID